MPLDSAADAIATGVAQLEHFGLSTYAAKTFVALASLGTGTAREIAEVSDVPRTRVYDAVDELHRRGLVDIQQGTPKQFWSISAETTSRSFEQEFEHRAKLLRTALDQIEPADRRTEQRGVWTVNGAEAVTARVLEFFDAAADEIVYMTVEDILTDEIVDGLSRAADRDVTIKLGGVSGTVQGRIEDEIPGAELFDSLWVWSDTTAGRLMMIDQERTLVSVLVNGAEMDASHPRGETAIWGSGESNSLVVVLRAIFMWQLDQSTT